MRFKFVKSSPIKIIFDDGDLITGYSAEEPERLRGPQSSFLWFDELAAARYHKEAWEMAMYGLRLGKHPRAMITTTPKPLPFLRGLIEKAKTGYTHLTTGSSFENRANLSDTYFKNVIAPRIGTRLGRQEIYAEVLGDTPGAFWTEAILEATRVPKAPEMIRTIIAIDPAVSYGEEGDETGIVVCGKGIDGHFYVLEDLSGRWPPDQWAAKVVDAYDRWHADKIIAEKNQGGVLISTNIGTVRKNLPLDLVWAKQSKQSRAEPVSSLWVQKKAHLVGWFGKKGANDETSLEDQLTTWVAEAGEESPDRLDAMVYAMTSLALGPGQPGWNGSPIVSEAGWAKGRIRK